MTTMENQKTFKDFFERIVCINYIEAKDRRKNIVEQFESLGFDIPEFYNAIPFKKIKLFNNIFNELAYNTSPSLIGCALSHYAVIKESYELGYQSVMIIEDDAVFLNDKDKIIEYLENAPKDWNYLYLTPSFCGPIPLKTLNAFNLCKDKWINLNDTDIPTGYTSQIQYWWVSSCCYALDRIAMKLYIDVFESNDIIMNSDRIQYFFYDFKNSPIRTYSTNIRLVAQQEELNRLKYNNEKHAYVIPKNMVIVPNCLNATSDNFMNVDKMKSIIR